ncbi:pilus assembly protein TadG-related protein [Litorimonas sp. RW-G-Af-16]|uniref:TadE/TadG family type IV pilus assembly protein n=1 Tax=Litorimonas sp. RW-G-Af-16 TaxID=3241168 RepID=UPI00390C8C97
MLRRWDKFKRDEGGNIAISFACISVVLMTGIAAAIDYSGMVKSRDGLQAQADSAVLAAALAMSTAKADDQTDYTKLSHDVMIANGYDTKFPKPTVTMTGSTINVNARVPYKLAFGKLIGKETMYLSANSVSQMSAVDGTEIALVLDNTASMNMQGRIGALKLGVGELIKAVEDSGSDTKIAMVPFSKYVNVGLDQSGENWLDVPTGYSTDRTWQQATHTSSNCRKEATTIIRDGEDYTYDKDVCDTTTTYETQSATTDSVWQGCVGIRPAPDDLEDSNYSRRIQGLLNFQPMEATGLSVNVNVDCPRPIVPLTNDYEKLKTETSKLTGTGDTFMPMGLAWGRRVLSPEAPFDESDSSKPTKQIMVLMSDGRNYAKVKTDAANQAKLNSPPYVATLELGEFAPETNDRTAELCEEIKADGIELYTISFMVNKPNQIALLRDCASTPSHAYSAGSNDALVGTFRSLSKRLQGEIRLTK